MTDQKKEKPSKPLDSDLAAIYTFPFSRSATSAAGFVECLVIKQMENPNLVVLHRARKINKRTGKFVMQYLYNVQTETLIEVDLSNTWGEIRAINAKSGKHNAHAKKGMKTVANAKA